MQIINMWHSRRLLGCLQAARCTKDIHSAGEGEDVQMEDVYSFLY